MNVTIVYRNDPERELTDPLPEPGGRGFIFRIYSGDVCSPLNGNWFTEPWPTKVLRFKFSFLPFISWRWPSWLPLIGNKCGYFGFKCYGADPIVYKNWMPEEDVYKGSYALCISFRPFATVIS